MRHRAPLPAVALTCALTLAGCGQQTGQEVSADDAATRSDGLGSSVFQATRVGSARLMVSTYGEGSIDSLDAQADDLTATTERILAAMCVFTRTGC